MQRKERERNYGKISPGDEKKNSTWALSFMR